VVLVPITCPVCGAAVDLEEGQTVVRCPFCKTSSYLQRPATALIAAPPRPPRRSAKPLVFVALGLVVASVIAAVAVLGGVGVNWYDDARPAAELLRKEFGKDARYAAILMHPSYMHARVMRDGTLHGVRIYGRRAEKSDPERSHNERELAGTLFSLDGVDFGAVSKIVRHAKKQHDKAELSYVMLQRPRQSQLLWEVYMTAGGDSLRLFYDLEAKPLVDAPLRFLTATPPDLVDRFRKQIGFEPSVVSVLLGPNYARVSIVTKASNKDTDAYHFYDDGTAQTPSPDESDVDAQELAKKTFRFADVDWKRVPAVAADARKRLGAEISQLTVRRREGNLEMYVYGNSDRGASRSGRYDLQGGFLGQ
jgi:hypothetical protein